MNSVHKKSVLRLRKRHGTGAGVAATAADGGRLVNAQSFRNAVVSGLIAIIVFSLFWVTLSALFDKVFPWFTVVLGIFLGFAIRLTGRGLDWRFPALAAGLALAGSLLANVIVAASVTAEAEGTATLHVLQSVTTMTWPVFFNEVLTVADGFFAVVAAGLAAFYANRKLTRKQYYALRQWREEGNE